MTNKSRLISLDDAIQATHQQIYWSESAQAAVRNFLVKLPRANAVEVCELPLEVKVTTDDFKDLEVATKMGYYRKHFFCPRCHLEIGHQTFDRERQFGQGTVLQSNQFPHYCPECGQKFGGIEDAEK